MGLGRQELVLGGPGGHRSLALASAGWKCVLHLPGVFSRPLSDLPEVRLLHLHSR